jgi:hypothetical protein
LGVQVQHQFEAIALSEREAQRISTAFYRFLEVTPRAGGVARMQIQPLPDGQRVVVSLPDAEALQAFQRFTAAFRLRGPTPQRDLRALQHARG